MAEKYQRRFLVIKCEFKPVAVALLTTVLLACSNDDSAKTKYLERGKAHLAEGNDEKARVEFKNVLQIDQAEQVLRDAISAGPRDEKRYLSLAAFLLENRGQEQALAELYAAALQKKPENPVAINNASALLADQGDKVDLKRKKKLAAILANINQPAHADN